MSETDVAAARADAERAGVLIVTGQTQPLPLAGAFIRNGFQNGPVEEFLFLGSLLARMSLLLGGGWGLVLSALIFGLFHLRVNARLETGGDLLSARAVGSRLRRLSASGLGSSSSGREICWPARWCTC